jgi:hypothetical protein
MRCLFSFLLVSFLLSVNAQCDTQLTITPKFKANPLELNKTYTIGKDTITFTNLKFYISNLQYFKNDSLVYTSVKKAHLIDLSNEQSFQINEKKSFEFDNIKFNIGIDSLTNVSGIFEGDLDPVNGMYWTWQSGYINFKLEGYATHCPSRNNKFNWHIGGYLEPFYAMREIALDCNSNKPNEIVIQLDELFKKIDVSKIYYVMSPNEKAIHIADVLPKIFKVAKE